MGFRFVFLFVLLGAGRLHAQGDGAGPFELGMASGHPGETVLVPVHATFDHPLKFLFAPFLFDAERLEYLRYEVEGSEAAHLSPLSIGYRNYIPGEGSLGIFNTGVTSEGRVVPPGSRRYLGNLVFRIRALAEPGDALVKPVRTISSTAGPIAYSMLVNGNDVSVTPSTLYGGSISVLEPIGPRPVAGLACAQYLDRTRLEFEPSAAYDAIEVARNGSVIGTLPGSARAFTDPLPGVGSFRYAVTGLAGGERSVPAECEVLAVAPAAPPVKELTCGEAGLSWTNPAPYDRIRILRDGAPIADLEGSATAFIDPTRPDTLTLYGVVAEVEGFRSPEAPCVDNGVWVLEAGDVQVPVGSELILVPIYATTSSMTVGFEAHLDVQTRLGMVRDRALALGGTAVHPEADQFFSGIGHYRVPSMGVIFDGLPPKEPEKYLAPGLRQLIAYFPLVPLQALPDGDTVVLSFRGGTFVVNRPVSGMASVNGVTFVSGRLRFGDAGLAGVRNLEAGRADGAGAAAEAAGPGSLGLTWENGDAYDSVRIERNGTSVTETSGDASSYEDTGLAAGVYVYKVYGMKNGQESFPASAFVSTLSTRGTFLRGDANHDDSINITDPLATLEFLFRGGAALPCDDAADSNDDGEIGLTDPVITLQHLFLGGGLLKAPGTAYAWFDPTPDTLGCGG